MKAMLRSKIVWAVVLGVLAVGAISVWAGIYGFGREDSVANVPLSPVARGPLTISVSVSGTIRPREQQIIKSEVEGSATIIYLIPEGTRVKKGDLLVELDVSKLQDQLVTQQIVVQNATAADLTATETLAVTESQAASDLAKAKLDLQFAKEDLDKYEKGDFPNLEKQATNKILLATEELQLATRKEEASQELFKEKYISKTQLDADVLALKRSQSNVELAENDRKLLLEFTRSREMAKFTAAVEQADMAYERAKRKASADIAQAKAQHQAKAMELERQRAIQEKLNAMIKKGKMYATTDGLVVYATTSGGRDREPLMEGQAVTERREIVHIPTADAVLVAVKIHESSLGKVKVNLPAYITVDAMPNKVFTGVVKKISPLPDAQSSWQNPDLRVYNADIWVDGDGSALRTGMTCRAEIMVDQYPDALYVPMQAVVRVGGKPTVYVSTPDGPQPRTVEVGLDNNRVIRILSGVEAGEVVSLAPPLAAAATDGDTAGMPAIPSQRPQTRPAGASPAGDGGPRRGVDGGDARPERPARGGRGARGGGGNLTPEQLEQRRQQLQSMSPEERQRAMEQFRSSGGRGNPDRND